MQLIKKEDKTYGSNIYLRISQTNQHWFKWSSVEPAEVLGFNWDIIIQRVK